MYSKENLQAFENTYVKPQFGCKGLKNTIEDCLFGSVEWCKCSTPHIIIGTVETYILQVSEWVGLSWSVMEGVMLFLI